MPPPTTHVPTCRQGYAFVAPLLHTKQLHSAANASEHFIGVVIDNTTGDVLEHRHLINWTNTERCRNTALQTNWDDCFRGYATYLAQTPVFSFAKRKSPNTNAPHTAALSAISGHKRMRSIALNSRWAAISSTSPATKAHSRQTSSPPNYSLNQQ